MFSIVRRPVEAFRALSKVLEDPDDTQHVFRLFEAVSGGTPKGLTARFALSRGGQLLLATQPKLLPTLADRDALRRLPEGSLGRAYLAFMEEGELSPQALVDASSKAGSPHEDYLGRRMRDAHDLWHVVCGYKGDLLGEACVLAFTYTQTWNPGIGLLVSAAIYTAHDPDSRRLIVGALARGLTAGWLPGAPWEEYLALPLEAVRAQLRVGAPPVYEPFWAKDLPSGGLLASQEPLAA